MGIISVETLLSELSAEAPCGEDLSDEIAYGELERAAQGTREQEIGGERIEAEEPNWLEVANRALELLQRTRDLRVLLHLTVAGLELEGLQGFRDGLVVLRACLERHWDHVHPQLDPGDGYDPTERVNVLATLAQPEGSYQDPFQVLRRLRAVPLCNSRQLGRASLRDIERAASGGAAEGEEGPRLTANQIEAAFRDTDSVELEAAAHAAREVADQVRAIDTCLTLRVGADQAPDLSRLQNVLTDIGRVLAQHVGSEAPAVEAEGPPGGEEAASGPRTGRPGEIRSPQDVLVSLENICRYYRKHEPSSPVPLLLRRAQGLVSKSFPEIVLDLTPDSAGQLEGIFGANTIAPSEQE